MLKNLPKFTFSKVYLFALVFFASSSFTHAQVSNVLDFDGVNDYVEIASTGTGILGDFSAPHDFTIEVYFRFDGSVIKKKILSDNSDTGADARGYFFETNGAGELQIGYGAGVYSWIAVNLGAISQGTWYHAALTYDPATCVDAPLVKWFLNGSLHAAYDFNAFGYCGNGINLHPNTTHNTRLADSEYWTGENGEITFEYVRFWSSARTNAEISADYQSEDVCNESDLLLQYKFDDGVAGGTNSSLTDVADCSSNGTDGSIHNMALTGTSSNFLFDNTSSVVLPVELIFFDVNTQDEHVNLRWATASEINNDGFEIQHSLNGFDWEVVDWVEGAGNTFAIQNYQFTHRAASSGINYYRLKQVDYDGQYEYSGVVSVDFLAEESTFWITPNPVLGSGTVAFNFEEDSKEKTLTIYSSLGAKVYQTLVEEEQSSLDVALPNLAQGIYTAEIVSGRTRNTKRMFIK